MLPTAETALVNLYAGEIIDESKLPMKFFAYTPCYRKEAGSYRAEERGMIRGHQFNKVEMVQYAHPDKSNQAFEELVNKGARPVLEPTTEPWGQRTCYISDPEGNLIEIGSFNRPFGR